MARAGARADIGAKQLPGSLLFDPQLCLQPRELKLKLLELKVAGFELAIFSL